jgi:hypothetical protein
MWYKGYGDIDIYAPASFPASETRIEVIDPAGNLTIVNSTLAEPNPIYFLFYDNNHNSKFDSGDVIALYSNTTGQLGFDPHVKAGFLVRIWWKDRLISDTMVITW